MNSQIRLTNLLSSDKLYADKFVNVNSSLTERLGL